VRYLSYGLLKIHTKSTSGYLLCDKASLRCGFTLSSKVQRPQRQVYRMLTKDPQDDQLTLWHARLKDEAVGAKIGGLPVSAGLLFGVRLAL
jgi:hypothetical protein